MCGAEPALLQAGCTDQAIGPETDQPSGGVSGPVLVPSGFMKTAVPRSSSIRRRDPSGDQVTVYQLPLVASVTRRTFEPSASISQIAPLFPSDSCSENAIAEPSGDNATHPTCRGRSASPREPLPAAFATQTFPLA